MQALVQHHQVYYEQEGNGQPVLFLHGNPDSAAMWGGLIKELKTDYRCIAPDLPGFGRSAFNPGFDPSLEGMAAWVDAFVQALGVSEPLHLVTVDFGAHFGLAWAILHPEKVASVTISNTNFFSDYEWHSAAKMLKTPLLGEFIQLIYRGSVFANQFKKDAPSLSPAYIREIEALYTPQARKMALRLYRATDSSRFKGWEDRLIALNAEVPSLVIWGDRDPYAPLSLAERFGAKTVHHYPGYGHWVMSEAPQPIAAQLRQLFEGAAGTAEV